MECLKWSSDGRYLASGGAEGAALVWDFAQARLFAAAQPSGGPVSSVAFSRDGAVLAHGGLDKAVSILSLAHPDAKGLEGGAGAAGAAEIAVCTIFLESSEGKGRVGPL